MKSLLSTLSLKTKAQVKWWKQQLKEVEVEDSRGFWMGLAGVAALGTGVLAGGVAAEQMAEDYAKGAIAAATGLDADAGILGTLGGWLSGD